MKMLKSEKIKKQNLSPRERKRVIIFSTDKVLIASIIIAFMLLITILNEAVAQAPYLNSKTAPVATGNNTTVSVVCNEGDGMISGGYSIGFSSAQSAFDTMVYSNHPIQQINQTGYFEGWESGLVNKGNITAGLTSMVLCLNLTLTP